MKKLKVNFDEIQKAMEDVVRDNFDYFLDIETGEVIAFSEEMLEEAQSSLHVEDFDDMMDEIESIEFDEVPDLPEYMEDEVETILDILLDESGRYFRIPERPSSVAYESMSRFIDTVADSDSENKAARRPRWKRSVQELQRCLSAPSQRKKTLAQS